jgi:hypothetical protein
VPSRAYGAGPWRTTASGRIGRLFFGSPYDKPPGAAKRSRSRFRANSHPGPIQLCPPRRYRRHCVWHRWRNPGGSGSNTS